ncbi:uncharacterized protein LOC122399643 [Colletes gigas]|uniref:uncharacterized protein LOC122399643 n=1 Tax=Colletes gigas TaxID=935657 RepID=UPI001C9A61AC|nr:uncharacterized protein LOC122399643 [Colletes gigas]
MQSSFVKLPLVLILCIVSLSYTNAEKKVTVHSYNADVTNGNNVLDSWSPSLSNGLITSNIGVSQNCPSAAQVVIKIFKDEQLVNTFNQNFKQPIKEFESYNICSSIDAPEPDDDSCSVAQGEHTASDCDLSSFFSDMDNGQYIVECEFKFSNNVVSTAKLDLTVEDA